MIKQNYVRIQVRDKSNTGKPIGIIGACWKIHNEGRLSKEDQVKFLKLEKWFTSLLPEPPFYKDGNPQKAICYFKVDGAQDMLDKITPLMQLLDKYEYEYDVVYTNYIGKIIYEDKYQVAVIDDNDRINKFMTNNDSNIL